MRVLVAFLVAFFAVCPARAEDAAYNLTYTLYAGGLKVVSVGVNYELTPASYAVHANAITTGFWSSLVPWRNMITARGSVDNAGVHPQMARYDDAWREKLRTTEFTFKPNGAVEAVATPAHKPDDRKEAMPEQKLGAMDPLSAVINLLAKGGADGCKGSTLAFDGRRVYNLVMANRGMEILAQNGYNLYSGPALRCEVTFVPVAGFPTREKRAGFWNAKDNTDKKNPLIIWVSSLSPGAPEIPVRVQSTVQLGTLVAHLTEMAPLHAQAALP